MPKSRVYTESLDFARDKLRRSGFTLIELLVTITIIAILAAIGLVTYSMALKQGRDSKRQSDLRAIQSALEQYNSDQLFYPYRSGTPDGLDGILSSTPPPAFTSSIGNPSSPLPSPVKTYINQPPVDPTLSRYVYVALPYSPTDCDNKPPPAGIKCTSYCLFAKLESPPSPLPSPPAVCAPLFSVLPSGYNFAVSLP